MLGEETARWVFDGAEGSVFGKLDEATLKKATSGSSSSTAEGEPSADDNDIQGAIEEVASAERMEENTDNNSEADSEENSVVKNLRELIWR